MSAEGFSVNEGAPGVDGTPGWAYDEDGYCTCCGNGRWKYHMPGCDLADTLEATATQRAELDGLRAERDAACELLETTVSSSDAAQVVSRAYMESAEMWRARAAAWREDAERLATVLDSLREWALDACHQGTGAPFRAPGWHMFMSTWEQADHEIPAADTVLAAHRALKENEAAQ